MLKEHRILWVSRHYPGEKEIEFLGQRYGNVKLHIMDQTLKHGMDIYREYKSKNCHTIVLVAPNEIIVQLVQTGVKPLRSLGWMMGKDQYEFLGFQRINKAVLETETLKQKGNRIKLLWTDNHKITKNQVQRLEEQCGEIRSLRYLHNIAHMSGQHLSEILLKEIKDEHILITPAKIPLWRLSWVKMACQMRGVTLVKQKVEPAQWYEKTFVSPRGQEQKLTDFEVVKEAIWSADII